MKKEDQIAFADLLGFFPEVELPVTLTEDTIHLFDRHNQPLPAILAEQFLADPATSDEEDLTEYIPCFRLPEQDYFQGIVFWRAGLLEYGYFLAIYDKNGNLLTRRGIAGLEYDGDNVRRAVATIDAELNIHIVEGVSKEDAVPYDASASTHLVLEVLPDGSIITAID